jgi:hypothetical protein
VADRKQDLWQIFIYAQHEGGEIISGLEISGAVELPRPMAALDAADHALRVAVRMGPLPASITVDVLGRADIGSDLHRLCSAVARYDDTRKEFMRYTPWIDGEQYQRIAEPEGASIATLTQV